MPVMIVCTPPDYSIIIISRVIDENVRKIAKNGDLKTRIYGSKNISSCRA